MANGDSRRRDVESKIPRGIEQLRSAFENGDQRAGGPVNGGDATSAKKREATRRRLAPFASIVTSGGIQICNAATGVILARSLSPSNRGLVATAVLWPGLVATVAGLGLPDSLTYFVARHPPRLKFLVQLALRAVVVVVPVSIALMVGIAQFFPARASELLLLYTLFIPLNLLTLGCQGLLLGSGRVASAQAIRLAVILLSAIGLVSLSLNDLVSPRTVIAAYLAANALTLLIGVLFLLPVYRRAPADAEAIPRRAVFGFGLRTQVSSLASLLNERLDLLVISLALPAAQLGYYAVASTFTSLAVLIGFSIGLVAFPAVAAQHARSQKAVRSEALKYIRSVVVLTATASLVMLAAAGPLVRVLFGNRYESIVTLVRVLLIAGAILSVNRVLSGILKAMNRPLDAGTGELMALVVTVVLLGVLLPTVGLIGAAIASLAAYVVSCAWQVRRLRRAFDLAALEPEPHYAGGVPPQGTG